MLLGSRAVSAAVSSARNVGQRAEPVDAKAVADNRGDRLKLSVEAEKHGLHRVERAEPLPQDLPERRIKLGVDHVQQVALRAAHLAVPDFGRHTFPRYPPDSALGLVQRGVIGGRL